MRARRVRWVVWPEILLVSRATVRSVWACGRVGWVFNIASVKECANGISDIILVRYVALV